MKKYSERYLTSEDVKIKIDIVKKWVEQFGRIWSRRVLYELVSNQLVKDTSDSQYQQVCNLFQALRHEGFIPYDWFEDKRTTILNVGIGNGYSFEDRFQMLRNYYSRSSKSLQDYYVEVWTEKKLSEATQNVIKKYEVGMVMGQGFIGDIPFHDAVERVPDLLEKYGLPIKIIYISDYDCEGKHTFDLCKEKLEILGDVTVEKLFLTKKQIVDNNFISNIGYRKRMMKPKTLKYHLSKRYVKDFIGINKDLESDGIVQYEFDQFPVNLLNDVLENTISRYINLETIQNTEEICRKEAEEWCDEHYAE